ncbi:MAG: hypothetical protein O8C61_12665 [Candidatus Methanoperedens sp.]|nr:hypothetical protein [Candidatus Methanoperedens sp.]
MLETPKERADLLKMGIAAKKIEELYISHNNFKIVGFPLIIGIIEGK